MNSWKARRPPACEPPLRTFWTIRSVRAAPRGNRPGELTGNWEHVWLLGAGQVGDVCVERNTLLSGGGLSDGHGDTEDGVGTQLLLVLGSIELVQERIDGGLVLDIDGLLDERRGNDVVDVANSLGDTLTTPLRLVSIAELASLV